MLTLQILNSHVLPNQVKYFCCVVLHVGLVFLADDILDNLFRRMKFPQHNCYRNTYVCKFLCHLNNHCPLM